jgi:hypothetical protein
MKWSFFGILCHLSLLSLSQAAVGKAWTIECGVSSNTFFESKSSINLRCISPRFKWSDNWIEDEDKHPDKYKNSRLMMELIYQPPLKVLVLGFNVQQRFVRFKKFSMELYGGMKFFFIPGSDFATIRYLKDGKEMWYVNVGLICQLNLDILAPFADIGFDGILTFGTEVNIHLIYKKIKRGYRPPYIQS